MDAIEITFACGHVGRVGDLGRLCVSCVAETYAAKDAEIARLTAELAAAKDELRSKDANYTPLLDSYAANCQRLSDALEASQERERVLREAIENAPHKEHCRAEWETEWDYAFRPFWVRRPIFEMRPDKCNCWKRAALGEP